ncbi:twin-arginine translocase TatA/TatE family subunit [Nesterenkonia sandarakina]|uniref:Sec-independent protein translocase protein TatB n=1 Tax=Nesterenkonia sandarakina TaxID=272918 RepID=A0A2T0YIM4_9MICC|nr:twin-arginine translocase TatA/TatE family subunit [Nesterenkonia sandarakina]PRZ14980.1 sec-independent protein translocase protein TatB [Nesterenkonia sandarakina]
MPGINAYEFVILVVLALVILGPERLPQYARNLARWARQARDLAEDAKGRFKDETGTDFDDVDWKRYDPRQYDPRRIIRDALSNEYGDDFRETRSAVTGTLDSARAATDPRELFRSKKDTGPAGAAPTGGVSPSAAKRSTGAVAAGMAGAGAAKGSAATGSERGPSDPATKDRPTKDAGTEDPSVKDPGRQVDAGRAAPFDTEAT